MTLLRAGLSVALVLLYLSTAAAAASRPAITVDEAVAMALNANLSLSAAEHELSATEWSLWSARASLLPSVRLSSSAVRVDPETYKRANASLEIAEQFGADVEPFLYETTYETKFTASMPIWNGGRLWGAAGVAGASRDAARNEWESTRRRIAVTARESFFGVLRADALLEVSREALAAAGARVAKIRRKLDLGLSTRAELLRWEVERADAELELVEAENALSLARTGLAQILGLPLDETVRLVAVGRPELDASCERFARFLDGPAIGEAEARRLLGANPDFLVLGDATRIAGSSLTVARGALFPSLNASASYGWKADDDIDPDDERAWTATLVLDLPVFTSFKNLADYQASKRSYLAALERQEDAERSLVAGLRNAVAVVASSVKALDAAEALESSAEEQHRNTEHRYELGMASYTDLADARVLHYRSRVGSVNALYDCFVALAELERWIGDGDVSPHGETVRVKEDSR